MKKLILASQSPRRRELMMMLDLPFSVVSVDVDEAMDYSKDLKEEITRVAVLKAESSFANNNEAIIVSADTLVVLDNEVLGKPRTVETAIEMLTKLSGRTHTVLTGVCIKSSDKTVQYCHESKVTFYELSSSQIEQYAQSKEPLDKAGAYGIQDKGALFIKEITGDYYSVMGLPISSVYRHLLEEFA